MNFTREPIVETIISAKEGFKLSIKSSKHLGGEEYLVDAVEMVSFSGAIFYRCSEKPKPFFLPIQDFEVQEVREAKLAIRSPVAEKSIKIGGGKEASRQPKPEPEEKVVVAAVSEETIEQPQDKEIVETPLADRNKREKRQKYRRKRTFEEASKEAVQREIILGEDGLPIPQVHVIPEPVFSHLLKPPESLISDSIHRYKKMEEDALFAAEVSSVPDLISEPPREYEKLEENSIDAESLIFAPEDHSKPEE